MLGCFTYHTNLFQCENGLNVYAECLGVHQGPDCFCRSVLVDVSFRVFCLPVSQGFFVRFFAACNGLHDAFNTVRYVRVVVLWSRELPCFWNDWLGHVKDHRVGSQSYSCTCFEFFLLF